MNQNQEDEGKRLWTEKGELAYLAKTALSIEKVRVASQTRLTNFAKVKKVSPDTKEILEVLEKTEAFIDGRLAKRIADHCTWPWAERIKGAGKENFAKVVGLIEDFGRYYPIGHPMIPSYVKRPPEHYLVIEEGKVVEKIGVFVKGIERLETPSKLNKYTGYDVDQETGEAPKRRKGHKTGFNVKLKTVLWRLATSFMQQKGIWFYGGEEDDGYSLGYKGLRAKITEKLERRGIKIVATPKERFCPFCEKDLSKKATHICPICGKKLAPREEPLGYFWKGHLDLRAKREMIQDFLKCLWQVWRKAEGLPVTGPYIPKDHHYKPIDPWKMVDK